MIERLQRIAIRLSHVRGLLLVLAGLSFIGAALSVIDNPWLEADRWLIPSLALLMWLLLLYSLSFLFLSVPAPIDQGKGWRERLALRLRRAVAWVLASMFLALTAALLILTYQLLRVALF